MEPSYQSQQPERTTLSWSRSSMALVLTACLFLRWLPENGPVVLWLVAPFMLCALGLWATAHWRYRRAEQAMEHGPVRHTTGGIVALTITINLVCAGGIWVVLTR
ncbi:DUF202 domain-containing protein [Glutamicibacter sp. PS]|uniref:DUF202 domain-containing protein n=1 Tax=Glutamicibacter sp. PS TaxID=3075634 RepID=UPI002847A492|nr:DUF202 domain-containing protein [Glutamicibacter sp. PS]MDR4532662.1 DUF202 domain-containing protein [Glutamicibacter sp. PS]